jgi:hypothetical protein
VLRSYLKWEKPKQKSEEGVTGISTSLSLGFGAISEVSKKKKKNKNKAK